MILIVVLQVGGAADGLNFGSDRTGGQVEHSFLFVDLRPEKPGNARTGGQLFGQLVDFLVEQVVGFVVGHAVLENGS